MKKAILILAAILLTATAVWAQGIDLGKFPTGKWMDSNWDAVWEFSSDNVRILDTKGTVIYDFRGKISDFNVAVTITEAKITFTCKDANRKYTFTKGVKDLDLVMRIDPDWSDKDYEVTLKLRN